MRKIIWLGLLLLGACGQQHEQGKNTGGAFQGDVDAYKKAQQVNQEIQQGAERERRQIDQQSGN